MDTGIHQDWLGMNSPWTVFVRPRLLVSRVNERQAMNNQQLELGFHQSVLRITVRKQRALRAAWWFEQMRRAVDSAIDWRHPAKAHPEQIQLIPGRKPFLA